MMMMVRLLQRRNYCGFIDMRVVCDLVFVNQILDTDNTTPVASLQQGVVFGEVCSYVTVHFGRRVIQYLRLPQ